MMNVILLEKVNNLGDLGDEVLVKAGFARNFLIPKGKAVQANEANRSVFEGRRKELEDVADVKLNAAQSRADKLVDKVITIVVKSGEEGKLYGSVGTQDIADALTEDGNEVVRGEVLLPDGAIRVLGEYDIDLHLYSDVSVVIKLAVVPE
jgi:large subunit ribosomal protein L9